jgi:hypothetical protein
VLLPYWSGWLVTIQRPPRPKRGALPTELHPVESGAHGRTRTSICNSDYGSPVRSRRRLRARGGWLPSQESNLPELCLTGSRVRLARLTGMNWWSDRVTLPAPVACKASVRPSAHPKVPGLGFEPSSPRLQRGAFTRLAFQANWCGRGESNSDLESGALALCLRAASAILVGRDRVERPQTMRGVYSALGSPMPSLPDIDSG